MYERFAVIHDICNLQNYGSKVNPMAVLNIQNTRDLLQKFGFKRLFIKELGWSQPVHKKATLDLKDGSFELKHIVQLSGATVIEVASSNGKIPDMKVRAAVYKEVAKLHHENLLIFLNK